MTERELGQLLERLAGAVRNLERLEQAMTAMQERFDQRIQDRDQRVDSRLGEVEEAINRVKGIGALATLILVPVLAYVIGHLP